MTPRPTRFKASRFLRSEGGAVTVETVAWIPFVFLISIAVADTFFVYMTHANAQLVLEDMTRQLVVGVIPDCATLETRMNAAVQATIPGATADCTMINLESRALVSLTLPAKEMGIGAIAGFVDSFELSATNLRTLEYFEGT